MKQRVTLAASFLIFIGIGLTSSIIGPALPTLADRVGTDLATIGALLTTSYFGTMIAQIVAGPLNDRFGARPVLLAGVTLAASGMILIAMSRTLWIMLPASVVYGFGFGGVDVTTNLLIAQRFAGRSVPVLNLLHVFFGVGSVIGPAVAGLALETTDTAIPALWVGVGVMLVPLPFVLRLSRGPVAIVDDGKPTTDFRLWHPLLWMLGGIMLLYVGVEAGLGSWITAYVDRSTSLGEETGALLTSGYWFSLTVGRVLGALYGGRFAAYTVLRWSLLGMFAGSIIFVVGSGNVALTVFAVLVMGVFSGPPFPTVIAIVTATFKRAPGRATSVVTALASVGAQTMPWLMGVFLDLVSPLAAAIFVLAQCILLVGIVVLIQRYQFRNGADVDISLQGTARAR